MPRILKDPEVRRQEILDTAMLLFRQKGYDATSIADIAKAMNVVPGLCYRYFSSKQEIFDTAVREYAKESCQDSIAIIRDRSRSFRERMDLCGHIMLHKEENSRHHEFFHTAGNETFHLQLGIEMINYLAPFISREFEWLNQTGEIQVENPDLMARFILFGELSLLVAPAGETTDQSLAEQIRQTGSYINQLINLKEQQS